MTNLADDEHSAELTDGLSQMLNAHLTETGDPRLHGEEPWTGYVYHQYGAIGLNYNESLPEDERRRARLRPGSGD